MRPPYWPPSCFSDDFATNAYCFFFFLHSRWHLGNSSIDNVELWQVWKIFRMVNRKRPVRIQRTGTKRQLAHLEKADDSKAGLNHENCNFLWEKEHAESNCSIRTPTWTQNRQLRSSNLGNWTLDRLPLLFLRRPCLGAREGLTLMHWNAHATVWGWPKNTHAHFCSKYESPTYACKRGKCIAAQSRACSDMAPSEWTKDLQCSRICSRFVMYK